MFVQRRTWLAARWDLITFPAIHWLFIFCKENLIPPCINYQEGGMRLQCCFASPPLILPWEVGATQKTIFLLAWGSQCSEVLMPSGMVVSGTNIHVTAVGWGLLAPCRSWGTWCHLLQERSKMNEGWNPFSLILAVAYFFMCFCFVGCRLWEWKQVKCLKEHLAVRTASSIPKYPWFTLICKWQV